MKRFFALLNARNKEFVRDRGSMAWSLLFPLLIIFGFSFAFSGNNQNVFKVAVYCPSENPTAEPAQRIEQLQREFDFLSTKYIQFIPVDDLDPALKKLERQNFDMVLSLSDATKRLAQGTSQSINQYWINSTSPRGYLVERILLNQRTTETHTPTFTRGQVVGRETRYIDWLFAGLLSMNVMFGSLFGVGYVIVRYRKSGVLRRLKATPVTAFEFLSAQIASRLFIMLTMWFVVLGSCKIFADILMVGSYFDLFVTLSLGALCLISLALTVAARITSEELAGGLLQILSWPMMLFSGVWFSLEGTHPTLQTIAQAFPLTHLVNASRAIMTEGATLADVKDHLIILGLLTCLFLAVSSWLFRWDESSAKS
jgi:ABC-type multidrug transport system permease subunit